MGEKWDKLGKMKVFQAKNKKALNNQSFIVSFLVEMAGVEPASKNILPSAVHMLSTTGSFNEFLPGSQSKTSRVRLKFNLLNSD